MSVRPRGLEQAPDNRETDDCASLVALLRACAKSKDLFRGTRLHDYILRKGLLLTCSDALVTMYAKCGALAKAKELFDVHKTRDVLTWTALIGGYVQQGRGQDALDFYEQMQHEGITPDAVTFVCILKACGSIRAAKKGAKIHDHIAKRGLQGRNVVVGTALVDMYAKCGDLVKAREVFEELPVRNVFSWTALITGYAQKGEGLEALNCFERMQGEGLSPNAVTFLCILKACGSIRAADKGAEVHDEIVKQGLLENNTALGNALVDMYVKCGALAKARQVLEELSVRNVVSWSALIAGYAEQGEVDQALECFEKMKNEGLSPNAVTFLCLLRACGSIGAAEKGEVIHDQVAKQGLLGKDLVLGNALVDMYAKCGTLAKAQQVLEELPVRDVITWSTLIAGYVQQGEGEQALSCFEGMMREGLLPDSVTFSCILKACGSVGAADKGEKIHDEIAKQGLLRKDIVLGTDLVVMYAKCGALTKARQVLEELPASNITVWNALIAGYAQESQAAQAIACLEQMQHQGLSPDGATFSRVLGVCSRLGLVEDAQTYVASMSGKYGMSPDFEHYTCIVDLFGRTGQLDKAVGVIDKMPSSYTEVWSALLGACQKWGDVSVAQWAFERAVQAGKHDGSIYVVMANIYAAACTQGRVENIEAISRENKVLEQMSSIDTSEHVFSHEAQNV